jgi:hypothetical protein
LLLRVAHQEDQVLVVEVAAQEAFYLRLAIQ